MFLVSRGQFWPSGIVVACVCQSVCQSLVRVITQDPFKLGSPNLKHRCKRPWLRSQLFWGVIDLCLRGQIYLQSQKLPHVELVRAITPHPFKLGPPNLDQRCKIPWLRSLLFPSFSVHNWSEMRGVVDVLTVLLLSPTQLIPIIPVHREKWFKCYSKNSTYYIYIWRSW